MNLVDGVALILIVLSAILGFTRGFVREVLGIGAWIGAGLVAVSSCPFFDPLLHALIKNPNLAEPVGFGVLFLALLILFSVLSKMLATMVHASLLSGLDHSLGIFFGIARGAALLIIAYIVGGALVPSDHWSSEIRAARSLPYIYEGATWAIRAVPEPMRPHLQTPPGDAQPGDTVSPAPPAV